VDKDGSRTWPCVVEMPSLDDVTVLASSSIRWIPSCMFCGTCGVTLDARCVSQGGYVTVICSRMTQQFAVLTVEAGHMIGGASGDLNRGHKGVYCGTFEETEPRPRAS
jgi:hypothetical protein